MTEEDGVLTTTRNVEEETVEKESAERRKGKEKGKDRKSVSEAKLIKPAFDLFLSKIANDADFDPCQIFFYPGGSKGVVMAKPVDSSRSKHIYVEMVSPGEVTDSFDIVIDARKALKLSKMCNSNQLSVRKLSGVVEVSAGLDKFRLPDYMGGVANTWPYEAIEFVGDDALIPTEGFNKPAREKQDTLAIVSYENLKGALEPLREIKSGTILIKVEKDKISFDMGHDSDDRESAYRERVAEVRGERQEVEIGRMLGKAIGFFDDGNIRFHMMREAVPFILISQDREYTSEEIKGMSPGETLSLRSYMMIALIRSI